jgi:hypothetical protein
MTAILRLGKRRVNRKADPSRSFGMTNRKDPYSKRQTRSGGVGLQVHGNRVEAIDVASGVVAIRVVRYGIRAAFGQGKKSIAVRNRTHIVTAARVSRAS